jgi:hypothetical protein
MVLRNVGDDSTNAWMPINDGQLFTQHFSHSQQRLEGDCQAGMVFNQ